MHMHACSFTRPCSHTRTFPLPHTHILWNFLSPTWNKNLLVSVANKWIRSYGNWFTRPCGTDKDSTDRDLLLNGGEPHFHDQRTINVVNMVASEMRSQQWWALTSRPPRHNYVLLDILRGNWGENRTNKRETIFRGQILFMNSSPVTYFWRRNGLGGVRVQFLLFLCFCLVFDGQG